MDRTLPIITTFTRSQHNPGDTFIGAGLQWICEQVVGYELPWQIVSKFRENQIRDAVPDMKRAGIALYAGTPQYNCYSEWKFWYDDEFWRKVINPNRIRVAALAGGSGGRVNESPEEFAERCANDRLTRKIIKRRTKYAHCFTVRDPHSHALLNRLDIENTLLPCTATFAGMYYNVPYAPQQGRVAIVPSDPDFVAGKSTEDIIDRFVGIVQTFLDAGYNPVAVCHDRKEFEGLRSRLKPFQLFYSNDFYSLLKFYGSCEGIVSARLHGTLPAWGIGAERAVNISIDSRGCAADILGIANLKYQDATPNTLLDWYENKGKVSSNERSEQMKNAVQGYSSILEPIFTESNWIA